MRSGTGWTKGADPAKWTRWSVGTLATCVASFVFYFTTLQSPPEVSAEEVIVNMDELLDVLDPDDGVRMLSEEAPEEAFPDWLKEDAWIFEENSQEDLWR